MSKRNTIENILSRLVPTEQNPIVYDSSEPCWIWKGAHSDGYGSVAHGGVRTPVHRVVYEHLVGPIPEGLQIDHLCRNRACANPAHLEAVTQKVNALRGVGIGAVNAKLTHCRRGHEFTPENTYIEKKTGGRRCRACRKRGDRSIPKGLAAENAAKTHCIHGHEFTTENTYKTTRRGRPVRGCRKCICAASARYKAKNSISE